VPLLLADAYHARVDIPALIAESGANATQADVLGEDDRLVAVLRQRLTHAGVSQLDSDMGVLVTAVGSSRPQANANTSLVADYLVQHTRWTATTAFATGPHPTLAEATEILRERGATKLVIAPWFLAHGRIESLTSHALNGFRWQHHLARTVWSRIRCWIASIRHWPNASPPKKPPH
jgi:sirohydrochlorin ferrochelatase